MYLRTVDRECDLNRGSTSSGLITATVKLSFPSAPNTQLCYMARWIFHNNITFHLASNIHTATNTVTVTFIIWTKCHKWTAFDNTCYALLLLQEVRVSKVMRGYSSLFCTYILLFHFALWRQTQIITVKCSHRWYIIVRVQKDHKQCIKIGSDNNRKLCNV